MQELVQSGLPLHEGQISVSSQSSARWLEPGGLGQTESGEHRNGRETREHNSCSADSQVQSELRKIGVGHGWNTMKQEEVATATADATSFASNGQRSSSNRADD